MKWAIFPMLPLLLLGSREQIHAALGLVPPINPDPAFLQQLERSFSLLASSTPAHRNTIRILFYGQSITLLPWWISVSDDLRTRYPEANLIIENRAINSHTVDSLILNAESDLYPFQPDLIIFHAYGTETNYERFLDQLRSRTTSDILIQADHRAYWDGQPTAIVPWQNLAPADSDWHSEVYMRNAAARWGACFADVRTIWNEYLLTNSTTYSALLSDGVHLNSDGDTLMADIIKPYLRYDPSIAVSDPFNSPGVRTYEIPGDIQWTNGSLNLNFKGSRVDAVMGPGAAVTLGTQIDGKKPSAIPGTWAFTRTSTFSEFGWPCISVIRTATMLQSEHWTLTVTTNLGSNLFAFHVKGSVTGDDGDGTNTLRFQSNSGRVVIDPTNSNWWLSQPTPGFVVAWDAIPLHVDELTVAPPSDASVESTITIAQGLDDADHTLELSGADGTLPAIRAIRVYSPQERRRTSVQFPRIAIGGTRDAPLLQWPGWLPGWQVEHQPQPTPAAWEATTGNPDWVDQTLMLPISVDSTMHWYRLRLN